MLLQACQRVAPLRCPRPTPEIDGEGASSHCPTTFRDPESVREPMSIVFYVCSPAGGTTAAFDFIGSRHIPAGSSPSILHEFHGYVRGVISHGGAKRT